MRSEKLQQFRALVREQRQFLDGVKERVRSNPNYDYESDPGFQERSREISRLSDWLNNDSTARQFDNPGSGAGREDTIGGLETMRGLSMNRMHGDRGTREERDALFHYLTAGGEDRDSHRFGATLKRATLSTASGAVGGYLVPEFVEAQVIQDTAALDVVRAAGAQVLPVVGRENIPAITDPTAAYQSEAAAIAGMTAADPTFGQVQIRPSLLNAFTHYSWHVQAFSPANVEQEISRSFGRALAKKAAEKFLVGSGTDEPQGLIGNVDTGVTAASQTAFTAEEITGLWNSLAPEFQIGAAWLLSPAAANLLRTLETTGGTPVWLQSLALPNQTLFGRPVFIASHLEGLTAGKTPIIVGDMRETYVIAESPALIVVDPYSRATNAENRVIAYRFSDGRVKKAASAKALKLAP